MAKEIERRYLVDPTKLDADALKLKTGSYTQGYVVIGPRTVHVRYEGPQHWPSAVWLTVTGEGTIIRPKFEFEMRYQDQRTAVEMLHELAGENMIQKHRYTRPWPEDGVWPPAPTAHVLFWEIYEFVAPERLRGLYLTEIELERADQKFVPPPWATKEVTRDKRWTNASLAEYGMPVDA